MVGDAIDEIGARSSRLQHELADTVAASIAGRCAITPEMADRLDRPSCSTADTWLASAISRSGESAPRHIDRQAACAEVAGFEASAVPGRDHPRRRISRRRTIWSIRCSRGHWPRPPNIGRSASLSSGHRVY